MSDEIIINIVPSASDNIQVNETSASTDVSISTSGTGVMSVNGRYGDIVLNKNDVGLSAVDNTSDLDKPLSNIATSAFDVVDTNINYLSSVAYSGLQTLSFDDITSELSILNGNTVPLSGYVVSKTSSASSDAINYTHQGFLPLSGGKFFNPDNPRVDIDFDEISFNIKDDLNGVFFLHDVPNNFDVIEYSNNTDDPNLILRAKKDIILTPNYFNNSSGKVIIDGTLSATNMFATFLSATSAVINVLDLKVYELSGFNVKGDVLIEGNVSITNSISTTNYGSTSNWFSVYNNVNSTSANNESVYNNVNSLSSNWSSVYNNVNSTSANYVTKNYATGYLPISGGNIRSLSSTQLTSNRISFSDLTFTGNSFYATASARCSFVEVRVGNTLKYLPLYDITKAIIYYVDFEGPAEVKASYASGNVTLSGISWNLTEALIGTETNEIISGARSARLRGYATTTMTMLADKADGISNISFLYRSYISPTLVADTTQVTWNVEYSTDTGTTWLTAGTFTALPLTQTFNANVNVTAPARIRFRTNATGSTNRRTNIDNITINPYT